MNAPQPTLRLIVVEDQQLFLELIVGLCERDFGFNVVATAATGAEALFLARTTEHDVVLLDLNLPDMDGIDVAGGIMADGRVHHILALSSQIDDYTLHRVVSSGIQGYVDKNLQSTDVLKTAIEIVASGGVFFTPVVQEVRRSLGRDPGAFSKVLSEREQELLSLLGRGLDDAEVAAKLGVQPQTIHSHRRNILRKLNLSGTKQLVRYALEHGFVRQSTRRT
jgi:DNA-binding NarL/FixJ family response regulator